MAQEDAEMADAKTEEIAVPSDEELTALYELALTRFKEADTGKQDGEDGSEATYRRTALSQLSETFVKKYRRYQNKSRAVLREERRKRHLERQEYQQEAKRRRMAERQERHTNQTAEERARRREEQRIRTASEVTFKFSAREICEIVQKHVESKYGPVVQTKYEPTKRAVVVRMEKAEDAAKVEEHSISCPISLQGSPQLNWEMCLWVPCPGTHGAAYSYVVQKRNGNAKYKDVPTKELPYPIASEESQVELFKKWGAVVKKTFGADSIRLVQMQSDFVIVMFNDVESRKAAWERMCSESNVSVEDLPERDDATRGELVTPTVELEADFPLPVRRALPNLRAIQKANKSWSVQRDFMITQEAAAVPQ